MRHKTVFWELVYEQLRGQRAYLVQLETYKAKGISIPNLDENIQQMQALVEQGEQDLEMALEHRHDVDYGKSTMQLKKVVEIHE